ncbi:MAG: hypothetical protein AAB850_00055 [Patescibacteria group bacterium]
MLSPTKLVQDVYQAEYDISEIVPGSFELAVGLAYSTGRRIHPVRFGTTLPTGKSYFDVVLTGVDDAEGIKRKEWEFRGILWHNLHAKKVGSETIKARVKGFYSTRKQTGKLYVLAHEHPKPLVEVISWDEMFKRISAEIHGGTRVVFEKKYRDYAMYRGCLTGTEDLDGRFRLDCACGVYLLEGDRWSPTTTRSFTVEIEPDTSCPLALADQRILFTLQNSDYTVYLSSVQVACP